MICIAHCGAANKSRKDKADEGITLDMSDNEVMTHSEEMNHNRLWWSWK